MLLLNCFSVTPAKAQTLQDIPNIKDVYPLAAIHFTLSPHRAKRLGAGDWSLSEDFTWGNTNALRENYSVDAETRDFRFTAKYGASEKSEVEFQLPLVWRGAGVLDPLIDGWHDFWNLPGGKRHRVADNSYDVSGVTESGEEFDLVDQGFGLGNAIFAFRSELLADSKWQLMGETFVSLPTASKNLGHAGIDVYLGLLSGYSAVRYEFTAGMGVVAVGDKELSNIEYAPYRFESFANFQYAFSNFSFFSSLTATSKIIDNIEGHPGYSSYLDAGLIFSTDTDSSLKLALRENIVAGSGGLDVGFVIGYVILI